jgi:hypothetical protein
VLQQSKNSGNKVPRRAHLRELRGYRVPDALRPPINLLSQCGGGESHERPYFGYHYGSGQ